MDVDGRLPSRTLNQAREMPTGWSVSYRSEVDVVAADGEVTEPSVAVLIVNWNTRDLLDACLRSLLAAEPAGFLEVIVVDNASADGSADMVRERDYPVVLVDNDRNLGFAVAVNQADALATAPYRLLLNSDTVVPEGVIRRCLDYLEAESGVAALGCRLLNEDGTHQTSVYRFPSLLGITLDASYLPQVFPRSRVISHDRYGGGDWDDVRRADAVMGSFMLLRRDAVPVNEPLLDEDFFMYCEEVDLCRRIAAGGESVVFHPGFEITHVRGASTSKTPEQYAWAVSAKRRGQLLFLRRWRRGVVSWLANLVMLVGLGPRAMVWSVADLLDRLRGRPGAGRRRQLQVGWFHIRALVRPSTMDEAWGPPPSADITADG